MVAPVRGLVWVVILAACALLSVPGRALLRGQGVPDVAVAVEGQEAPALVVFIVVDQLRADLLDRYGDLFSGGFRRLLDEGRMFTNATHDHLMTETAPGHATARLISWVSFPLR